jgi:phosphohistidine swiveling domain-containing protein
MDQLAAAAQAVYRSWNGPLAGSIVASTGSKGALAGPSPSRQWYLAMPAAGPAPASPSRARAHLTRFADKAPAIATAVPGSPGVATWRIAFDSPRAKALAAGGEPVVLVRHDTSTEDIAGFAVAAGILTAVGGRTAHAAVVARQLGTVSLVGCHELKIREDGEGGETAGQKIVEGDWISLDGDSGEVTLGRREIIAELPRPSSPRSTPDAAFDTIRLGH